MCRNQGGTRYNGPHMPLLNSMPSLLSTPGYTLEFCSRLLSNADTSKTAIPEPILHGGLYHCVLANLEAKEIVSSLIGVSLLSTLGRCFLARKLNFKLILWWFQKICFSSLYRLLCLVLLPTSGFGGLVLFISLLVQFFVPLFSRKSLQWGPPCCI